MDHSQCRVTVIDRHDCPPCPHGLMRGYETPLTGDSRVDDRQRQWYLRYIESLACDDDEHARALAEMNA